MLLATESHLAYFASVVSDPQINSPPPGLGATQPRSVCRLSAVKPGACVCVKQLLAAPELCQRLRELGLGEERRVRLLLRHRNLICQVGNGRLGMSRELADAIVVESVATKH
jgi:Fe2+ transport system protein FeoA